MEIILAPIWPIYNVIRVLVIFLDMILLFVIIFAGVELFHYRPHFVYDPRKPVKKHHNAHPDVRLSVRDSFLRIKEKMKSGNPEAIRLAIIEADGLVDNVLKSKRYEGETFADRLSKINPLEVQTLDRVWNAHRLRNDIVHTPGFEVSLTQAEKAMEDYEAFLKDLGAWGGEEKTSHHGH